MIVLQRNSNAPRAKLDVEKGGNSGPAPQLQRRQDNPTQKIDTKAISNLSINKPVGKPPAEQDSKKGSKRGPRCGDFEEAEDLNEMPEVVPRNVYKEQKSGGNFKPIRKDSGGGGFRKNSGYSNNSGGGFKSYNNDDRREGRYNSRGRGRGGRGRGGRNNYDNNDSGGGYKSRGGRFNNNRRVSLDNNLL